MKLFKTLAVLAVTGLAATPFAAITQDWKISSVVAGHHINHAWFGVDGNTTGLAYNPATGHLLVLSRTGPNAIYILNSATGAQLGSLDMTGVSGGTIAALRVCVTDDGVIYMNNLVTNANLKIYRWANESAAPTVAFDQNISVARIGDDMDVTGTGNGTKILITNATNSGPDSNKVFVLTTTDGGLSFSWQARTASPNAIITATSPLVQWDSNGTDYWVKVANSSTLQRCVWNSSGSVDTSTNLFDSTAFTAPVTNQMSGFDLVPDSSNPGAQWIAYALGQQYLGNTTPAVIRRTSAIATTVHSLRYAGGNLNGSVNYADTARRGKAIIRGGAEQKVYLLNVGNSIVRYSFSGADSVPVNMSNFAID